MSGPRFEPEPFLAAAHSMDVGEVRPNESMARHTTLHVGGAADVMVVPTRLAQVERLIELCLRFDTPLTVLGRGSNLLVRDSGLPGVALLTERLGVLGIEDQAIEAWAGVTLGGLANRSARAGLTGLEWCAGIPGSVGGGVFMNAGAHGGQMADHVRRVAFLPLAGPMPAPAAEPTLIDAADCGFAYRTSRFQREPGVILWAELGAEHGDAQEARERLRRFREQRKATQPLSWPNCGSVFRNPQGGSAGRLVEAAGGKGHRIGYAGISDVHGNFIVNYGGARAEDVLALIEWAQEAVYRHSGVVLETEVRVLP